MLNRVRLLVLSGLLGSGIFSAMYAQPAVEIDPPPGRTGTESRTEDRAEAGGAADTRIENTGTDARTGPETVTVTGNLTIVHGGIAVQDKGVTYYVHGLARYIRFIESLKYGAAVSLQGFTFAYPPDDTIKFLQAAKLTIDGKDYDLAPLGGTGFPKKTGHKTRRRW
ncbi:MAG: hypothetical protein LBD55_09355 [Treponema sp.]|jgi:hypothetical protein|nr:hypothetical protein [Treponema sp.]